MVLRSSLPVNRQLSYRLAFRVFRELSGWSVAGCLRKLRLKVNCRGSFPRIPRIIAEMIALFQLKEFSAIIRSIRVDLLFQQSSNPAWIRSHQEINLQATLQVRMQIDVRLIEHHGATPRHSHQVKQNLQPDLDSVASPVQLFLDPTTRFFIEEV